MVNMLRSVTKARHRDKNNEWRHIGERREREKQN